MLTCCANPNCKQPFRFINTGRIYEFDFDRSHKHQDVLWESTPRPAVEHFWLCENCCQSYTLVRIGAKVKLKPHHPPHAQAG